MYKRILHFPQVDSESYFLWGPRQSGKSTLLKTLFPQARYYDLLKADVYRRLQNHPEIIREELEIDGLTGKKQKAPIIIDEVQKIPRLLDEVHWLIVNRDIRFILCGSSARKLKHGHANLLGGRAIHAELHPLVSAEIPGFNLEKAINNGLLPRIYTSNASRSLLDAYIGDYLKEEIAAEALTRNIPAFGRFLEVSSFSNGEMVNFNNIAQECGVSAPTVREYFQILEDTMMGYFLPGFRKRAKRRTIAAPKFYFFDVGIAAALTRRGEVKSGSELFGRAFEHFICLEIMGWLRYSNQNLPLTYWRTASGFEVDFILGEHEVALEVKSTTMVRDNHLKGLRAFMEEHETRRVIVVSLDTTARKTADGIEIIPWARFLEELWSNKIMGISNDP